jgi:hypothetical protein
MIIHRRSSTTIRRMTKHAPCHVFVDKDAIVRAMYLKGTVTADSLAKGLQSILGRT